MDGGLELLAAPKFRRVTNELNKEAYGPEYALTQAYALTKGRRHQVLGRGEAHQPNHEDQKRDEERVNLHDLDVDEAQTW